METVRLSTKGQLVISKEIRKAHHLAVGAEFVVSFVGDEIRLIPLPMFPRTTVAETAGLLAKRGRKSVTEEKIRASIMAWAELHQEELLEDWDICQKKQHPKPIKPLA